MKHTLLSIPLLLFCINTFSQFDFSTKIKVGDTGADPQVITVGDINNDGYDDILVATYTSSTLELFTNNTDGTFTKNIISNTLTNIIGVTIADLNDDGFNDIIATGAGNGILAWYLNNQSGTFNVENIISSSISVPITPIVGDLDNNNTPDIAVIAYGSGETLWFSNDGSGSFGTANLVVTATGTDPIDMDMGDIDGDGDLDIVVGDLTTGAIEIYDNKLIPNGSVSFVKYDNTVSSGSQRLWDVLIADVNDDGSLDIIKSDFGNSVSTSTGDVTYYTRDTNSTSTTFTEIALVAAAPQRPGTVLVADFTGDGFNDVVYVNSAPGDIIGLESTSTGGFNAPEIAENTLGVVYAIAIGKFDDDGSLDIAAAENNNRTINVIINNVVLGIEDYTPKTIKMYPNPVSQTLNFEGLDSQQREISIFNTLGQKILATTLKLNNQIDVSSLSMGLYFLKFKEIAGTFKFIKE